MNKTSLRRTIKAQRSLLTPEQVTIKSHQIATMVQPIIAATAAQRIHIYAAHSAWNEVSTVQIQDYIRTALPSAELTIGPVDANAFIPNNSFEIVFVPLLAFDTQLNRLGLGSGWYDRFLAKQPNAVTIGLAYELQLVDAVPNVPHDVPLTMVVTEKSIYHK